MSYIAIQFIWYIGVLAFISVVTFGAAVAFVVPNLKKRSKKKSAASSDVQNVLVGGEAYYFSVALFVVMAILRLIGIVWWLSYSVGSEPSVITTPANTTKIVNQLIDNTPHLNASWPIGVVFWTLSGLLFVFFALIVNDGHGYHFLHIFHREMWNSFIGLILLIGALISCAITIICFGLAFTWPGYGTVFGLTVLIPLITEILWAICITVVWTRHFLIACCYYGSAPHTDVLKEPEEDQDNV